MAPWRMGPWSRLAPLERGTTFLVTFQAYSCLGLRSHDWQPYGITVRAAALCDQVPFLKNVMWKNKGKLLKNKKLRALCELDLWPSKIHLAA